MTRKDIEKAAEEYANDACRPLWRTGYEQVCMADFIAGAKWRVNSVWHSTSEEPEVDRHCIIEVEAYEEDGTKYTDYVSSVWSRFGWTEDYLELIERRSEGQYKITRWAYVEDLLPNKEE